MAQKTPKHVSQLLSVAFGLFVLVTAARGSIEDAPSGRWFHIDGYTVHFDAPGAQHWLLGSGLTIYRKPSARFARAWEADLFRDSANKLSGYLGHSWMLPFGGHYGVGFTGAVMYHRNFQRQTGFPVLPVALPFLQFSGRRLMARMYYIPPVRRKSDHQISFQLLVPF